MSDDKCPKILVVEDNDSIRHMMEMALHTHDYAVHGVCDAQRALLCAGLQAPDLILLDINLGGPVSGWEVLDRLKANQKTASIPVIMVSALGQKSDLRRAKNAGAFDYVVKPATVDELLLRVKRALIAHGTAPEEQLQEDLRDESVVI